MENDVFFRGKRNETFGGGWLESPNMCPIEGHLENQCPKIINEKQECLRKGRRIH